jgi:DNA primase catalytic core
MKLDRLFLDQIRDAVSVVDVFREAGRWIPDRNTWAPMNCPFHDDESPSASVSHHGFRCHGCGASGDLFKVWMNLHPGVSFPEAVRVLAERAGVVLNGVDLDSLRREREARQRVTDLREAALTFYRKGLVEKPVALEFLTQHWGLLHPQSATEKYLMGYAPERGGLRQALMGFSDEEWAASGLLSGKGHELFRDRLVFPFLIRGSIVAFAARALGDRKPKWQNACGPKGLFFGLDQVPKGTKHVRVVEGIGDVLRMDEEGLPTIAGMQVSVDRDEEARRLLALFDTVEVVPDSDRAKENGWRPGREETLRFAARAIAWEKTVLVRPLPEPPEGADSLDPADFLKGNTRADFDGLPVVSPTIYALDGKADSAAVRLALGVVKLFKDPLDRDDALAELKGSTGRSRATLKAALKMLGGTPSNPGSETPVQEGEDSGSQATALVALAEGAELFHDSDQRCYATIDVSEHRETWSLRSRGFKGWLKGKFYSEKKKAAKAASVEDAVATLEARALHEGRELPVFLRVAEHESAIYLDLADADWRAIRITAHGWEIIPNPPVRFLRHPGMLALRDPVQGGTLSLLRPFVNVASDEDFVLLIGWMVGALRPNGHGTYAILGLHGEQGSAKSTTAKVLRCLIDPNSAPLRSAPRDEDALLIGATRGWSPVFNNLSGLPAWFSDALCCLVEGGGLSKRMLYTDEDEVILKAARPVTLTGIEELERRSDLLDRCIILVLPTIPEGARKSEDRFWKSFNEARSKILGALLDAVVSALANLPEVKEWHLAVPRLADFAEWVTAAELALEWPVGTFLQAYGRNRSNADAAAIEASPLGPVLLAWFREKEWTGTATQLLEELESFDSAAMKRTGWPKAAHVLSGALRRIAPNLRKMGLDVSFGKDDDRGRTRRIWLRELPKKASEASEASAAGGVPCAKPTE